MPQLREVKRLKLEAARLGLAVDPPLVERVDKDHEDPGCSRVQLSEVHWKVMLPTNGEWED